MYGSAAFFLSASVDLAFCAGRGAMRMDSDSRMPDVGQSCDTCICEAQCSTSHTREACMYGEGGQQHI